MTFGAVPVEEITGPLRAKVEKVAALGGDTRFFQFAAHAPEVADFYWGQFYRDLFFQGRLPVRVKELVRLRLAALNGCPFCQVGDAASAKDHGVTDEEIAAVLDGREHDFTPAERAALTAAEHMANVDPYDLVDDATRADLVAHFSQAELVELLVVIGVLTGMARMLAATGFMDRACPVPRQAVARGAVAD